MRYLSILGGTVLLIGLIPVGALVRGQSSAPVSARMAQPATQSATNGASPRNSRAVNLPTDERKDSARDRGSNTPATVCGSAKECLERARYYAAKLDWDSAITVLKEAIAFDPRSARAQKDLAAAYIGPSLANIARHSKEDYRRAEAACRAALSLDASDPEAYLLLGRVMNGEMYDEDRADDEVIGVIRSAITLQPRNGDAYCELARAYTLLKRYDDAIDAYDTEVAIRQETRRSESGGDTSRSNPLVGESERQHEFADAIQAVDNCNKLDRHQDALARLQYLETLDPGDHVVHFMAGQELVKLGDLNSAKQELRRIEDICRSQNPFLVANCEGYAKGLAEEIQRSR